MRFASCKFVAGLLAGLACLMGFASAQAGLAPFDLPGAIAGAKAGDTIRVPAGVYDGPITISKAINLIGQSSAILDGHGNGTVVQITAEGATLRGFLIRGSGDQIEPEHCGIRVKAAHVTIENNILQDVLFGIIVHQGKGVVVRNNEVGGKNFEQARRGDGIRLWYSPDCLVEGNSVHDVRDVVIWFSKGVHLKNNHVVRSRYGLHFMYCDDNVLEGNRLEENSVGVYLMNSRNLVLRGNVFASNRGSSGYGLGLKDMDGVEAQDNRFVGNRLGIYIDSSPNDLDIHNHFTRNLIAYNDVGIAMLPNVRRNQFRDNTFQENQEQVAILGGGQIDGNDFTVDGRGNFWSDYKGFDRDGDGIGDLPYQSQSLFENLMDREPKLRLFLYSPAQQALEMASQAVPTVRPRPKLVDTAPLMRPVPLDGAVEATGFNWSIAACGFALLAVAAVTIFLTTRGLGGSPMSNGTGPSLRPGRHAPALCDNEREPLMSHGTPVLHVNGLTKRFGRFVAVDDLSFDIRRGQAVALWGSNGAGKTTAIRCILGLIRSRGTVAIAGRDLRRNEKAARGMIGYVPQENSFQGDLGVLEALRYYGRLKGVSSGAAERLLKEVGLADHGHKRVSALSGGMRKRLALAAALLNDPPLLILDEIAANLDAEARQSFLALLCRLKEQGKTILFTSHRLDEVEVLADRVLVLKKGKLDRNCPPRQLAAALGLRCEVKLIVPEPMIEPALDALRTEGFAARRNGRGVWVGVAADSKAAPIHLLARRQIVIENFELETPEAEHSHEHCVN